MRLRSEGLERGEREMGKRSSLVSLSSPSHTRATLHAQNPLHAKEPLTRQRFSPYLVAGAVRSLVRHIPVPLGLWIEHHACMRCVCVCVTKRGGKGEGKGRRCWGHERGHGRVCEGKGRRRVSRAFESMRGGLGKEGRSPVCFVLFCSAPPARPCHGPSGCTLRPSGRRPRCKRRRRAGRRRSFGMGGERESVE